MAIVAPPNPESRDIAKWFTDHERRINRVESGLRTAQLGNSSLNGTGMDMFDANGNYRGTIGFQGDGNTTVTSVNPLPPPVPSAPSITPGLAHLLVTHSGETADGTGNPTDFSHLKVYVADAILPEVRTFTGTINPVPGEYVITGLDYTNYLVTVTAVNLSGKESAHSTPSSGTPVQAVSADLIAGIIQENHLNSNIVGAATLKANAVTATKISDDAIETRHLTAGSVDVNALAANSVNAGKIVAGSVTTDKIAALAVTANEIAANAITAGKITTGSITAAKLEANLVLASRIIAGSASGARVEMHPTSGLQAYLVNGTTRTFWINASTGEAFFMGEISTAASGTRLEINPGGNNPDRILFFPTSGVTSAYIDTYTVNSAAVIRVSGPDNAGGRGEVLAWADEGAIRYAVADSQLPKSVVTTRATNIEMAGPHVVIAMSERYTGVGGVRHIQFIHRNSSGNDISNSMFQMQRNAGGDAWLQVPTNNIGIVFNSGICGSVTNAGAGAQFGASSFVNTSSARLKTNIKRMDTSKLSQGNRGGAKSILKSVSPVEYQWAHEVAGRPSKPGNKLRKQNVDGTITLVDAEWLEPEKTPDTNYGFLAEELPIEVQRVGINGDTAYSLDSMLAILWARVREQDEEIEALKVKVG